MMTEHLGDKLKAKGEKKETHVTTESAESEIKTTLLLHFV